MTLPPPMFAGSAGLAGDKGWAYELVNEPLNLFLMLFTVGVVAASIIIASGRTSPAVRRWRRAGSRWPWLT